MKITLTILLTLSMTLYGLLADVLIREESHTDAYEYGGVEYPAGDSVSEIWLGDTRMAYSTPARKIIVDEAGGTILIANLEARTYVRSALPLKLDSIIDAGLLERLRANRTRGTVEGSRIAKTVEGYMCRLYDITVSAPTPLDIKIWASDEVPLDWRKLREMYEPVMRLANHSQEYIESMMAIRGLAVVTDITV